MLPLLAPGAKLAWEINLRHSRCLGAISCRVRRSPLLVCALACSIVLCSCDDPQPVDAQPDLWFCCCPMRCSTPVLHSPDLEFGTRRILRNVGSFPSR